VAKRPKKSATRRKERDYSAEYARRKRLARKRQVAAEVAADARRAFGGKKPKRGRVRDPRTGRQRRARKLIDATATAYRKRLKKMAGDVDVKFSWLSEAKFVAEMRGRGLTSREAYTLWFSP
jgi:hypothetical protein